ncbi:microtubule-associated protein futsch isoform X2 [Bradysia coprophila]|uniref:microtubule-associated protein futsch isoform X2 n=1 Tax=Bradysia coprophila TaxID=38358 RepID=UPI00187DD0E0|nr:microtubule-associated protein futsch isoform X2 [Bradysia coprophila]
MASEVSELSSIKDEDLLRRMWQQTEDFCRKKEIRAHMYKLREERLRNFYTGDMDAGIGMSKSPMIPSHGDSLADQSFQSLKAKEIRDCASPTRHVQYDMGTPDTSGWNVISTSQLSSDGKEQRNTTLATTDAVQDIKGGKATFSGKNELIESHRHDGDDKNYTSTSGHASNTILKEHVVTGDDKNGRTESISNTTSSTSKTTTSSKYQSDNSTNDDFVQEFEGALNSARRSVRTNQSNSNNDQFERPIPCNDFEKEYFNSKTTNQSSSTTSNQQSTYEIRRNSASSTTSSVDARKIQRETEYLANAPGQLISRSVEYPDANTKVITETKTLPDGSTVTTTKYETRAASSTTTSKSSKQEKSSTSRVVTEDRAERNRIEVIAGDNKNVIEEVVKSKRVIDADDAAGLKPDSNESIKEKLVRTEIHRNENARQNNTQKETLNQEFIHKDTANEQQKNGRREEIRVHKQPVQSEKVNKETTELYESTHDRFQKQKNENVTSRMEIAIEADQQRNSVTKQNAPVQSIDTDDLLYDKKSTETHKTVKKDLSRDHERYTKARPVESDLPDEHFDRQPVVEEQIVPKKEIYHVCSPSHDHSPKPASKTSSKPSDYTSKRISVDHNPTHEAFARSLRCVTPEIDKRSVQSSTYSVKSNYTYTDRDHRSPSRDTNVSDTSKISSTTVTKSKSPNRKLSPEKRKTTISSETIDITSSEQFKNEKKTESTVRKGSQTFTSNKTIPKSEDHYDHPRNNQPLYDIPTNNAPVRKNSSDQPSYSRPTASSARHNVKPDDGAQKPKKKDNDEPIYETVVDRPSNDRRHSSKIDSKTTVTTTVTRETNDYRNVDRPIKRQPAAHHPEYESNFDSGRSNSPTSSVSDIEYVNFKNTNRTVTDLDEIEIIINTKDKTTNRDTQDGLFLSTHKKKASSPSLESDTDTIVEQEKDHGVEPFYLNESQKDVKETRRQKPPLTRSETYEERCRSMLGMKMESEERETVKNSKQASTDLIISERKVENRSPLRSPTKSPDRKSSTNAGNVDRSPSRSPDRKPTSTKSTVVEEDGHFDTFTRSKGNKSSSPKRTPLERPGTEEKIPTDTSTFERKSSKVTNNHTTSPVRSNSSSPDRKRTSEVTKQFMKEEIRSNSFTTKSTKTKNTQNETVTTRETSPKREPKSDSIRTSTSPKRSPNRSPNTSPSRNRPKENVVEATKKLINSESVVRKNSKSEFATTSVNRSEERDTQTKQNKVNKEPRKSPTRVDRTSPARKTTDETFTETSETFFSETKADTIKRRPGSENRNSIGKSNATSPDRKPTNKEVNRKSVSDENKVSTPKKSTHVNTDSQDASRTTTNTFTRKKTSETIETNLSSPTKSKGKPVDNALRSSSPVKNTSAPSKLKAKPAKIDIKSKPKQKQPNNYSTDDDSDEEINSKKSPKKMPITERKDSAPVYRSTKVDKEVKMARSTSEHFSATSRKGSKPEIETPKSPQKFEKRPTKCMTTKTINLSTANTINSEDMENVIIDIQQAKSSREPTPNRIIPTPVSPEEDTGKPRYPDTVHEPDDERPQRRPNIKNIPIFEENTKEYISCHITEVSEDYGASDSDECMLSVSDKVTKFSTQVTSPTNEKFRRNVAETVNEFSEDVDDECRLSVQGKVSKFTAIAEEVNTTKTSSSTKKECNTTAKVNEKVAQFTEKEVRNSKSYKPEPVKNTDRVKTRRDFEDIDETLKSDECLLSVSDKVNKFVATAETLTASVPHMSDVKSPELVAKVQRQVSLRDTVTKPDNGPRTPSDQHDSGIDRSTPRGKITDRYVPNKSKPTSSPSVPISLSSIDVVKKAKSIFERGDSPKAPKQRDILTRPSIWEQRRAEATKTDVKLTDIGVFKTGDDSNSDIDSRPSSRSPESRQSSCSPERRRSSRSPEQRRPSYIYERAASPVNTTRPRVEDADQKKQSQKIHAPKKIFTTNEQTTSKKPKPIDAPDATTDKRSYMNHTIASLEHIRRDSIEINKSNIRKSTPDDEVDQVEINPKSSVKFGVELKRTNSQQSAGRRKSSCSEIPHVEEIFELELLERMLDTVVGYEQRRRIRAQIRLVKKQIQDEEKSKGVKKTVNTNRTDVTTESWRRKQEPSPTRSPLKKKNEDGSEYTSKFNKTSRVERTTSPVRKTSPQRRHNENAEFISSERTAIEEDVSVRRSSPNRKSSIDGNSNAYRNEQVNSYVQMSRSPSPRSNKVTSNLRNTAVKQVNASKSNDDDKPIWARKNILTKASDSTRTFTSTGKKTTVTKVQKQKTVEQNDDCVTSSYGIGPTDEDGKPLFGIRALKKKSPAVQTSKVSGTIIQETLFSDNGAPPTGNRTTTMYSSDPQDIRHFVESNGTASDIRNRLIERENSRRGVTSVTTSQTITAIDTPEDMSASNSKQPKIVRRGSVKELSEKFQKESTKSSEKTTSSYPKAGLILRTQTSRESTPGANSSLRSGSADFDDCDIEVRCSSSSRLQSDDEMEFKTTTTSRQHQSSSFLNSNRKVTNVQDVLNRMRNADNVTEDGDTEEDKEARALLNKFLGASVLMSGMESMVPREITSIVGAPSSQKQITTTHVTKTVKSTSSPSTTRELKTRDIDSIWDEVLLKQLLDQSSSYEERRKIRARLRQVMAEKEVCADIVASVTAELKQQKLEKETSKKMEVKPPAKKEESEEEEDDDDEYEYEEVEVTDEDGEEESEHEAKVEVTKSNDSKKTASTTTTTAAVKAAEVTKTTVKVEEKKESSQESKIQVKSDESSKTVTTTQSITTTKAVPAKPISPFAKFRQLDKQVSTQSTPNSPNSPSTPKSPGGAPLFKFTDPVLSARAATVKDILLQWCQSKTKEYENVQITNFSTAWSDGLAFCALCHHFLPDSFDYSVLTPKQRRHNFTLAFRIMDEKAGIAPLLDVEDMVIMRKPDWKCVFTYVQSIHRRFRNVD